jgi:lipopolysaccharide transport system ATP-binding protein
MYVRLAFGVAAHLEPEILIVDEVLAVGDAEFQKKALGKMRDVSGKEGRTVLFVSHNMQSIAALTSRCLLLENGVISSNNETSQVINQYFNLNLDNSEDLVYLCNNQSETEPRITRIELETSHPKNINAVGETLKINFEINVPEPIKDAAISYQIYNSNDVPVLHILNLNSENNFGNKPGKYILSSIIQDSKLYPDKYYLKVHFADHFYKKKYETLERVCPFEVKYFGEARDYYWYKNHAIYLEDASWKIEYLKKQ